MSNKLHYKGYTAEIYYSAEDNLIFGKLEGIKDLVNFHSDNTNNIVQHFHDAVDDYLELCAEIDKEPEKPYVIELDVDPIDFCGVVCDFAEELIGKAKSEAIKEFVKQAEKKRTVAIHCDVYEEVVRLEDLKEMEVASDTV